MNNILKLTAVASGSEDLVQWPHERDRVRAHMRCGNGAGKRQPQ